MIRVAHSAGFCFGVRRAVELAERLADRHIPAVTLGPLIHNPDYVAALARRGVAPVDGVEQAPPGCTVVSGLMAWTKPL